MEIKLLSDERVYPTYSEMIKNLFKPMATVNDQIMHAAIGLAGEISGELFTVDSKKNLIEEGGDIEFYLEALKQQFEPDFVAALAKPFAYNRDMITLGNVVQNLAIVSGDILDIAKKSWVYNKPLDRAGLTYDIVLVEMNLDRLFSFFDVTREEVRHANQVKLIGPGGRFESGFYSDGAAIARADKNPGQRNFIGQKQSAG